MAHYIVAIGGSGSRCAEGLAYLCAAGLGPADLTVLFVDPDVANGNVQRAIAAFRWYLSLQVEQQEMLPSNRNGGSPGVEDGPLFMSTKIQLSNPEVWTPFHGESHTPRLGDFFEGSTMRARSRSLGMLFDTLYSPEQQSAHLDVGFRGRPSMGSAVFGAKVDLENEEPWRTVAERIKNESGAGQKSSVFVFGSSFGGTGAAGLPTIPRLLKGDLEHGGSDVSVGGALLLPYFSFVSDQQVSGGELYADPSKYLLNAQAALKYYADCNLEYDRLYVLGTQQPGIRGAFSLGGQNQCDSAHVVELLAGLACVDFFRRPSAADSGIAMIARRAADRVVWSDVPDSQVVQPQMAALARMSMAYINIFWPTLVRIKDGNRPLARVPWYVDFFLRPGMDLSDGHVWQRLENFRYFASSYLTWLREVHHVGTGLREELKVELANPAALLDPGKPESLTEDLFDDVLRQGRVPRRSLNNLWRRMCDFHNAGGRRTSSATGATPIRFFFNRMFQASN